MYIILFAYVCNYICICVCNFKIILGLSVSIVEYEIILYNYSDASAILMA